MAELEASLNKALASQPCSLLINCSVLNIYTCKLQLFVNMFILPATASSQWKYILQQSALREM
jgi:hypothetical protein